MSRYFITLLLLAILSAACKKDKLPKPTQSGKNILACRINGKVHVYSGKIGATSNEGVSALLVSGRYYDAPKIYITAFNSKTSGRDEIELRVYIGDIELNKPTKMIAMESRYINNSGEYYQYHKDANITFTRFDSDIAAGHFEFHGQNRDSLVDITDGWFDIQARKP